MSIRTNEMRSWFVREILPLEPALIRFLRRNWRIEADLPDLRQEVYARICDAAIEQIPLNPKSFLFSIARNHLIDRARRARIVSFELVADLETSVLLEEAITPERQASAREELRRVLLGLERLPRRCRQVIEMRKLHGMSQKETAQRLGMSLSSVEQHTTKGMRALVNFVLESPLRVVTKLETDQEAQG